MEQRKHPRVQLPLLVELKHPALKSSRHIARNIVIDAVEWAAARDVSGG